MYIYVRIPFEENSGEYGTAFAPLCGMLISFDGRPSTLFSPLNKYKATEATARAVFMKFRAFFSVFLKLLDVRYKIIQIILQFLILYIVLYYDHVYFYKQIIELLVSETQRGFFSTRI